MSSPRPYPTHGEPIAPLDRSIDEWAAAEVARMRALPRIPKTPEQLDYEEARQHDWTWR